MKKFILDEIDHQILDILIENARTPFTDIAKKLLVSAGTIHVRVKKMEDENVDTKKYKALLKLYDQADIINDIV